MGAGMPAQPAKGRGAGKARFKFEMAGATQVQRAAGVVFAEHVGSGTPTQVRKALRATGEEGR